MINGVFDVLDVGRMAVLKDPQGAVLEMWQPGTRIGAERVNEVGCLGMNELVTTDIDAARLFYEGLFGWTTEAWDTGLDGHPMVLAKNGETVNASFTALQGDEPARWRPCFTVESTDSLSSECANSAAASSPSRSRSPMGASRWYSIRRGPFSIFAGDVAP